MTMYIIDIGWLNAFDSEEDSWIAESIYLHRDLIRGYTLVPSTVRYYKEFLETTMGKYVSFNIYSYEVRDNLNSYEYSQLALNFCKELSDNDTIGYASTCPEITMYEMENGGYLPTTEAMQEYSTQIYEYEEIMNDIVFLFDDIIKYIIPMKTDNKLVEFRQLILDGLLDRIKEFYGQDGLYTIDPFPILKRYIEKIKFIY